MRPLGGDFWGWSCLPTMIVVYPKKQQPCVLFCDQEKTTDVGYSVLFVLFVL